MTKPTDKALYWLLGWFLAIVISAALLCSCNAYKKVAGKANPTAKERSYLAQACTQQFPYIDKPVIVDSVIAISKNYKSQIDSLNNVVDILDSVIHQQIPIVDTAFVDTENCLPRIQLAFAEIDKLNQQKLFLQIQTDNLQSQIKTLQRNYKPCDSVLKITTTVYRCDSARMQLLQDGFKGKSDSLLIMTTKYQGAKKQATTELWIIIAMGIVIVGSIFLKVKKMFA